MTYQISDDVANAYLDAMEVATGTDPILEIRTGAPPANCAAADSGIVLSTSILPTDWMAAAASRQKAKSGTWSDASADGTGDAGHFRIKNSLGTVCHHQGTVTATGGGGDMTVSSIAFTAGTPFTITGFTWTAGNP